MAAFMNLFARNCIKRMLKNDKISVFHLCAKMYICLCDVHVINSNALIDFLRIAGIVDIVDKLKVIRLFSFFKTED